MNIRNVWNSDIPDHHCIGKHPGDRLHYIPGVLKPRKSGHKPELCRKKEKSAPFELSLGVSSRQ